MGKNIRNLTLLQDILLEMLAEMHVNGKFISVERSRVLALKIAKLNEKKYKQLLETAYAKEKNK